MFVELVLRSVCLHVSPRMHWRCEYRKTVRGRKFTNVEKVWEADGNIGVDRQVYAITDKGWSILADSIMNSSSRSQEEVNDRCSGSHVAQLGKTVLYYISNDIEPLYRLIGLVGREFANGPEDRGSIPGRVIPKTFKKWYLIPLCLTLSIIRYVSRVKWSNPGKGVAPSPTPRCSIYWKGSLLVALNYSRQLFFYYKYSKWDLYRGRF